MHDRLPLKKGERVDEKMEGFYFYRGGNYITGKEGLP
jgi:hypothetical protein